jgi:hypothetical protein
MIGAGAGTKSTFFLPRAAWKWSGFVILLKKYCYEPGRRKYKTSPYKTSTVYTQRLLNETSCNKLSPQKISWGEILRPPGGSVSQTILFRYKENSIWRIFRHKHYRYITLLPMFLTQYTPDFFVAEHYGLRNTTFCRSDIFRLENFSVWQIPVFRFGLLMRNRGYIEFGTMGKQCLSYLRNIKTAINYFLLLHFLHFAPNLPKPIFLIEKIWMNIGICQTLGFSILKMPPQV